MPHLTVEYSANLESQTDIDALCAALLATMLETGYFEIGGVRVRAHRTDHHAIADRMLENAFVDLGLRIGKGRSASEKKRTGEMLFATANRLLAPVLETPHFALSLEIREIDPELSWKTNSIHSRLRGK